ncbi:elongation of very long chain fatty acids protein AAEL008004-like [Sitophilus oryzae]|uniref:Elongation of very long chain fatty acids protein n=1 Tax=Sitophilus oryzae TaxID=7048 RepID=A0A6J2XXT8_SITOR|nr:elongation of very long chain fatty acids protein AAEL008004-like [Sitophilus oryzae]
MALLLKRIFENYFWLMNDLSDPRTADLPLMSSPLPVVIVLFLYCKFVFDWGPNYMKNRPPFDLKYVMILYNTVQVLVNSYVVYICWTAWSVVDTQCTPVDYSNSYWGLKFLKITYLYFLLKMADLLDTVFFVLRKKNTHISFLHTYHHFGMVVLGWIAVKFIGGGHCYFVGLANCIVHSILYAYYLLTAYDSKYGRLVWLKKFITQTQLIQFGFILFMFTRLLFLQDCGFPKIVSLFLIPQNLFIIALFGDFYIRSYVLPQKKKEKKEISPEEKQE